MEATAPKIIKLINEFHGDENSYQHLRLSLFHAFGGRGTVTGGPRDGSTGPRRGGRGTGKGVACGVGGTRLLFKDLR